MAEIKMMGARIQTEMTLLAKHRVATQGGSGGKKMAESVAEMEVEEDDDELAAAGVPETEDKR